MTITVDDVKLLKSQRLSDEADGGAPPARQLLIMKSITFSPISHASTAH